LPGHRDEIWALGLRNPWRFSFDRQADNLYIGDVGQTSYEEIDFQPKDSPGGENYGWDIREGFVCFQSTNCASAGLTPPIYVYPTHSQGSCAITGGFVYRGTNYPILDGIYFYADYCSGIIWGLQRDGSNWVNNELEDIDFRITSFGEDQVAELYLATKEGEIYQIISP
jgi:glucose/arabinose dehydrogenase